MLEAELAVFLQTSLNRSDQIARVRPFYFFSDKIVCTRKGTASSHRAIVQNKNINDILVQN